MSKREPQIILKTDERKVELELGLEGKFAAQSTGWDENQVFLEDDKLEVAVENGRWCCAPPGWAAAGYRAGTAQPSDRRVTPSRLPPLRGRNAKIRLGGLGILKQHTVPIGCRLHFA